MELRQLKTFKRVADLKSFTRAAESLSLTQPTISHQMRLLAEDLGQDLFEIQGRRVGLTSAGRVFLSHAEAVLAAVEEARRAVEDVKGGNRGVVRLAAIGSSTVYVLPDVLYKFRTEHPQIDVILQTASGDAIRELVRNNQVDLGIVGSHVPTSEFDSIPLFKDRICPFVHGKHPLARRRRVMFAELAKEPLIQLGTWRSWQNYVLSIFRQVDVAPEIRLQLDSLDAVKRMVERGLGFTVIPDTSAREEIAEGKLVALFPRDVPPLVRQVLVIRRRQKVLSKAQQRFLEFLQQEVRRGVGSTAA